MILPRFAFRKASSIDEALALHKEFDGNALYLSGGTDLVPRIKLRLTKPEALIDLKGIKTLETVEQDDQWIRIGAMATISDLMKNPLVSEYVPAFQASLAATSCETLQMRGTIGGNLLQNTRCLFYNQSEFWRKSKGFCLKMGGEKCNAVPGAAVCLANYCSDNATALLTVSAEIVAAGPEGQRQFPLGDLFSGKAGRPFILKPGEILTHILVPKKKTSGGYEKLRLRGSVDYPLLGVALSSGNGTTRLAVGAVGPRPYVFDMNGWEGQSLQDVMAQAKAAARPAPNTVVETAYRRDMIPVFIERLAKRLTGEAK
jgi:4-hydroxybenzoyl-CoA reductase subunit beta